MRSIITSPTIGGHPDINPTPMLECQGSCDGATAHEFSHLELSLEYQPENPPAFDLSYRCDTCNKARRWGSLTWERAHEMDPSISERYADLFSAI